jgi:hypothetical protein
MTSNVIAGKSPSSGYVGLDWMHCSNEECGQLIIRAHEEVREYDGRAFVGSRTDTWIARPRFGSSHRRIDPLVPEPFRSDYAEAAALLDISPRMSAVLARRIVGDLLKTYASKTHFSLTARIDSFIQDGRHPSGLTENLHHLREIADFSAHTQEEVAGGEQEVVIIDVDRDEAEWTLDVVDRLFDYFIVTPAKDEAVRQKMDKKIDKAGRKPLRPESSETET